MSTRALTLAVVNDYEVVVRGLAAMLGRYRDRLAIMELDATTTVGTPVDLALYDSFAATQSDRPQVHELAQHPLVGTLVVYS